MPESTVVMGTNDQKRRAKDFYLRLGQKRAAALIGWYAFKGTDNSGSFATMGVKQQFSAYMAADNEILEAIETFTEQSVVLENLVKQMERYLCLLYGNLAADLLFCMNCVGTFSHGLARKDANYHQQWGH